MSASSTSANLQLSFPSGLLRRLTLRLTLSVFLLAIITILGARWLHFGLQEDPFLPYRMILPGASDDVLVDFGCQSVAKPPAGYKIVSPPSPCSIFPKSNSLYHLVTVETRDSRVSAVTFYSQFLQIDQLMQQLGEPQTIIRSKGKHSFTFKWDSGDYEVVAVVAPPLGSTYVRIVTLSVGAQQVVSSAFPAIPSTPLPTLSQPNSN